MGGKTLFSNGFLSLHYFPKHLLTRRDYFHSHHNNNHQHHQHHQPSPSGNSSTSPHDREGRSSAGEEQ
ncbi:unnamed protein product, partial [Amoebophrya sp. A25]